MKRSPQGRRGRRRGAATSAAASLLAAGAVMLAVGMGVAAWASSEGSSEQAAGRLREAWALAGRLLANDAERAMREVAGPEVRAGALPRELEREVRLGRAVTLLSRQPTSQSQTDTAAALLEALIAEDGDDEAGVSAAFALARLEQLHRPIDADGTPRAVELYRGLAERHPGHELGQMARVKLAMIRLYEPSGEGREMERWREVEPWGVSLRDPAALRDFHLLLADACAAFGGPDELQLDHLLRAEATGELSGRQLTNTLVRLAQLGRATGRREVHERFGRRFVAEYPRDERAHTVLLRLREAGIEVTP